MRMENTWLVLITGFLMAFALAAPGVAHASVDVNEGGCFAYFNLDRYQPNVSGVANQLWVYELQNQYVPSNKPCVYDSMTQDAANTATCARPIQPTHPMSMVT
jgi:hypothetical protein